MRDKWFLNNLRRTLSLLPNNQTIILNVPYKSSKGQEYIISEELSLLQGNKFIIYRCEKDEGSITKLLPALRNQNIKDNDIIIVCDDDIVYKENIFSLLENSVSNNRYQIFSMCGKEIQGFRGFAFYKKVLKGLLDINIPNSCFRIDDDVINWYANKNNITVNGVSYDRDTNGMCSIYKDKTDTHPKWDELGKDNRKPMIKKCISELNNI